MNARTKQAARLIECGKLISFPTETVYALACSALDEAAISRVYEVKGRDFSKPLAVLSPDFERLKNIVVFNESAMKLAQAFCPGPLTLVLPKSSNCGINSGLQTLAVRIPDNPIALEILRQANCPVFATSANPSGKPEAVNAQQVNGYFPDMLDMVIDGGPCAIGKASTIVDLSGEMPVILREGSILKEQIMAALES